MVRDVIARLIKVEVEDWDNNKFICLKDLNRFQNDYVENAFKKEKSVLTALEQKVLKSMANFEVVSDDSSKEFDENLSFGQRLADTVADFGGSWGFIILFFSILIGWMTLNTFVLGKPKAFDPYPYILLNLVLSCLAAIQAPIIMMSQNRQEARDRLRSEHDYRVNLKAELEIQHLNTKMDLLLNHLWTRLMEIQGIQLDMMQQSNMGENGTNKPVSPKDQSKYSAPAAE